VLKGLNCHINVIPLNDAPKGLPFQPAKHKPAEGDFQPSKSESYAFAAALEQNGLSATVRRALGSDIEGACGQLKRRVRET